MVVTGVECWFMVVRGGWWRLTMVGCGDMMVMMRMVVMARAIIMREMAKVSMRV